MGERPPKPESLHSKVPIERRELSPEIIEMVMEKVEDINASETAFHVLGAAEKWHGEKRPVTEIKIINDVLRDGILGQTVNRRHERQSSKEKLPISQRGTYVEDVKKGELPRVWFDIIGRADLTQPSIAGAFWMQGKISVAVVFDLSKFTDGIGKEEDYEQRLKELEESGSINPKADYIQQHSKIGTFFPSDGSGPMSPLEWNDEGLTVGTRDFGHLLLGRVSPRHFKGIALRVCKIGEDGRYKDETDQTKIQNEVDKIVTAQSKIYQREPNMLLPIYDVQGNLLWPEQLSYEKKYKMEEEK